MTTAKADGPEKPERTKRKLLRSPNYPFFSLDEAIEKVRLVYDHERRHYTTPEVVLNHLGYANQRSGSGGRALSALRQYGLLEERDGQYRVSDLANRLLHTEDGAPERKEALRDAALKPMLFRELLGRYQEGLPSDATLRSYLIHDRDFNPTTVDHFIRTFRKTIEFAKPSLDEYTSGDDGPGGITMRRGETEERSGGAAWLDEAVRAAKTPTPAQAGLVAPPPIPFLLSQGRQVRAELRLSGREIRREDIERLKRQVLIRLDELAEAFDEEDAATNESRPE